jgi:hypothetical protein
MKHLKFVLRTLTIVLLALTSCEKNDPIRNTADLEGSLAVYDHNGSLLSDIYNINVLVTDLATGNTYDTITDSSGVFYYRDLPNGSYLLEVQKAGFTVQGASMTLSHRADSKTKIASSIIVAEISKHLVNLTAFKNDTANQKITVQGHVTSADTASEFNLILFFSDAGQVSSSNFCFKYPNYCWCEDYPYVSDTFQVDIPYGEIRMRHDPPESIVYTIGYIDNYKLEIGITGGQSDVVSNMLGTPSNTLQDN